MHIQDTPRPGEGLSQQAAQPETLGSHDNDFCPRENPKYLTNKRIGKLSRVLPSGKMMSKPPSVSIK